MCVGVVAGLMEGVDYAFRVLAENVEGVSEALTLDQNVRPIRAESESLLAITSHRIHTQ